MKCFLLLILTSFSCFAQNKSIKIQIDSVTSEDSIPSERKFTINYHIENLTNNEVSFFLTPNTFSPSHTHSMGTEIFYELTQNEEKLTVGGVFSSTSKKDEIQIPDFSISKDKKERQDKIAKYYIEKTGFNLDSIRQYLDKGNSIEEYQIQISNKRLIKDIYKLSPKENKNHTAVFYWDKKRYYKRVSSNLA